MLGENEAWVGHIDSSPQIVKLGHLPPHATIDRAELDAEPIYGCGLSSRVDLALIPELGATEV